MNTTRVTITEAAQILGRKPDTLKNWIQDGCPHAKEGDSIRLSISQVFDWNVRRAELPLGKAEAVAEISTKPTRRDIANAFPLVMSAEEIKNTSAPTTSDALRPIIRRLLELQRIEDKWAEEISTPGLLEIDSPISGNWLLLDFALDILGIPREPEPEDWEEFIRVTGYDIVNDRTLFNCWYAEEWFVDVHEGNDLDGFMEKLPWP